MAAHDESVGKAYGFARSEITRRQKESKQASKTLDDLRDRVRMAEKTLAERQAKLRKAETLIEDNDWACFEMSSAVDVLVLARTVRREGDADKAIELENESLEKIIRYTGMGHNGIPALSKGF